MRLPTAKQSSREPKKRQTAGLQGMRFRLKWRLSMGESDKAQRKKKLVLRRDFLAGTT
jgi:hypothetical protein